jgi:hypothetical protein
MVVYIHSDVKKHNVADMSGNNTEERSITA